MSAETPEQMPEAGQAEASRRAFLAKCGKFAVVTPPVVTLLLNTSMAEANGGYGSPHKKKRRRRRRRRKHNKDRHHHHDHPHRRGRWRGPGHDEDHDHDD